MAVPRHADGEEGNSRHQDRHRKQGKGPVVTTAAVVTEDCRRRVRRGSLRRFGDAVHGAVGVLFTGSGRRTQRHRHVPAHVSANWRKSPRHGLKRQHENKQQNEKTTQHAGREASVDLWILAELLAEPVK
jgi:hypothetical protein